MPMRGSLVLLFGAASIYLVVALAIGATGGGTQAEGAERSAKKLSVEQRLRRMEDVEEIRELLARGRAATSAA